MLVTQFDAAKIEHGVLHGDCNFLPEAGSVTLLQCGQDADRQMHAGITIAQCSAADGWRAVPKTGRAGCAASCLRDVVIDFQVFIKVTIVEAFYRCQNQTWIQFLNGFPSEAHAVECAWRKVLNHDVGLLD